MDNKNYIDWVVIAFYFAVVLGLAFWAIKRQQKTSTYYFLAGWHLIWFIVGASIFASNIGSNI